MTTYNENVGSDSFLPKFCLQHFLIFVQNYHKTLSALVNILLDILQNKRIKKVWGNMDFNSLDDMLKDNNIGSPQIESFDKKFQHIVMHMLGNLHGYADTREKAVHLYIQITSSAISFMTLYTINDGIYEAHALNESKVEPTFDVSLDRQKILMSYLSEELINAMFPLFEENDKRIPNQICASYDMRTDHFDMSFSYNFGEEEEKSFIKNVEKWKNAVTMKNDNDRSVNMLHSIDVPVPSDFFII